MGRLDAVFGSIFWMTPADASVQWMVNWFGLPICFNEHYSPSLLDNNEYA